MLHFDGVNGKEWWQMDYRLFTNKESGCKDTTGSGNPNDPKNVVECCKNKIENDHQWNCQPDYFNPEYKSDVVSFSL